MSASLSILIVGGLAPYDVAAGKPAITGVPQDGRMLTASMNGIGDGNGLPLTFKYQWVRVAGRSGESRQRQREHLDAGRVGHVRDDQREGEPHRWWRELRRTIREPTARSVIAVVDACSADNSWRRAVSMRHCEVGTIQFVECSDNLISGRRGVPWWKRHGWWRLNLTKRQWATGATLGSGYPCSWSVGSTGPRVEIDVSSTGLGQVEVRPCGIGAEPTGSMETGSCRAEGCVGGAEANLER